MVEGSRSDITVIKRFYFNYLKNCGRVHATLNPEKEKKEEKKKEEKEEDSNSNLNKEKEN